MINLWEVIKPATLILVNRLTIDSHSAHKQAINFNIELVISEHIQSTSTYILSGTL